MMPARVRQRPRRGSERLWAIRGRCFAPTLILGYGSRLRGDDAAGARVATTVARWRLPHVHARALHQLTPDLAEPLAQVSLAIFVDARLGGGGVHLRPLCPTQSPDLCDIHTSDPALLLALAQLLYGRAPRAWLITLPAQQFVLGTPLSPLTRRALPVAYRRIRRLLAASYGVQ
ncbi:MAG: hydrogenase maturation protease [Oscillochloris sp.]|nr:hydrogenase maturation protease [Oscillochloris sp.]